MTNYICRQATIDDISALAELFDRYRMFYEQQSDVEGARRYLLERFEHQQSIIFIAEDAANKQYAGFTQIYPTFSSISMKRSLILNDLYVDSEYRGNGISKLLLDNARHYAQQIGAKGLALSTASDNIRAQRIYERYGFVKDEEFFNYFLSV